MPSSLDTSASTPRWVIPAGAVAILVFLGWVVPGVGGPRATQAFDDLALVAAPLVASIACAFAARRASGKLRWAWGMLAAGSASWAAGNAVWSYYELIAHREVPFPSAADIGYLGLIPFVATALFLFPTSPHGAASRTRAVLDGLIVGGSLLFLSWPAVLGPTIDAGGSTVLERWVGLAYPLGDVILVSILLLTVTRARGGRVPLAMIGLGLAFVAFSDSAFAYLNLQDSYSTGNLIDAGWLIGFVLLAIGATQRRQPLEQKEIRDQGYWMLLPYVPVLAGIGQTVLRTARGEPLDPFLMLVAVVVWLCVLSRQFATLFENVVLARSLGAKVSVRTEEVRSRDEQIRSLLDTANDAFIAMEPQGNITAWNSRAQILFGWSAAEAIGRPLAETVVPERYRRAHEAGLRGLLAGGSSSIVGNGAVEMSALHRNGHEFPVEMTIWSTGHGEDLSFNAFVRDITERKRFEQELEHQALHDSLTGLPNRALFGDRLSHALSGTMRSRSRIALLFLDLDDFKIVNDSFGHAAGDDLLIGVARQLRDSVRPRDTVARLGGDEFAILMEDVDGNAEAIELARRMICNLRKPIIVQDHPIRVRVSVGIAAGNPGDDSHVLMRNADVAMYKAKSSGKGRFEVFVPEMHEAVIARLELQSDLAAAIERDEVFMNYQPIVDLTTGRIHGFEALARWMHPRRGAIQPEDFIPLAEETGAIVPLGRWALETACRDARIWSERHHRPVTVSVNVSSRQLDPEYAREVASVLNETGLPAGQLVLEFTESLAMRDTESTMEALAGLKALGIRLAIDDFGTGYSSLGYLERFPVDILKIDKSFVRGNLEGEGSMLARAVLKIASALDLRVVAEGVELAVQAKRLKEWGCEYAQGYLFSRPVAFADAEILLLAEAEPLAPARLASLP